MKTDDSSTRFSLRRPQDGAVLVVVLLAMIGLLGMGLAGLYLTSGNIQMNSNINMRNQALYVAEGGIQVAKGILNRPYSDPLLPSLGGMLSGTTGPSGATVATPTGYTDEIPGRAGTNPGDYGCSGKTSTGISTRGAYLRDDDPPPLGFGCQTSASTTAQAVYIGCNYPPTYSYTDSNGNSISYNATPPDPNGMSATPTQYMGQYTLFIRQDLGECRQGYVTTDSNGIVVIRSEGTASDNRTKVVLEVTMSTNPNTAILSQAIATVCPAGAAGCDDNASVQQGITVGPPGAGGAPGSGGSGGTGGTSAGCTKDSDCATNGGSCCNGACVDRTTDSNNCGGCNTKCSGTLVCCGGQCLAPMGAISDTSCGPSGSTKCISPQHCCPKGCSSACVDETTDQNNCGGCGNVCVSDSGANDCCGGQCCYSPKVCCSNSCQPAAKTQNTSASCGVCGVKCSSNYTCCSGACKYTPSPQNNISSAACGPCGDTCSASQCCGPSALAYVNNGNYYSCVAPPCNAVATMGIPGLWDMGWGNPCPNSTGLVQFTNWLGQHSGCTIPNIDITDPNNPITPEMLAPLRIIIVLDISHTPTNRANRIADVCAGKYSQWDPAYPETSYDKSGRQRLLAQAETDAIVDWVNGGGGLLTTVGYDNYAVEATNVNGLLRPFGLTYSTQPSLLNVESGLNYIPASGFSTVAPIASAITAGVTSLRVTNATVIKGWSNNAEVAIPSGSSNIAAFAAVSGYTMGAAAIASPYTASSGRVIAWGDEWITYDAVLTDSSQQGSKFWNNVLAWLSAPCVSKQ